MTATRKTTLIISALAVAAIATLLALHLLANDPPHDDTDLVPDFIDTIPIDQFDGSPIRYLPGKKRLYSVGTNLIDDGGQSEGSQLSPRQDDLVLQIDPPPLPELIDSSEPDQSRIVLPAPLKSK